MVTGSATRMQLPGHRWHFQHGPIDLVVCCDGDRQACNEALEQAWKRFQDVLAALVPQLAQLRSAVGAGPRDPPQVGSRLGPRSTSEESGSAIAARMIAACLPYARRYGLFITPMAAVAGSVADDIVAVFCRPGIERAYVNNGGDIALHLAPGHHYDIGVVANLELPGVDGRFSVDASSTVRGIATSGWRGRSFSLGIADSVTVLASSGAAADAAATLVANCVNVESAAVQRRPASALKDDSDLGERLVTVAVGDLSDMEIGTALARGVAFAEEIRHRGLIAAAALSLGGRVRVVMPRD